jgi:hypothetical protein
LVRGGTSIFGIRQTPVSSAPALDPYAPPVADAVVRAPKGAWLKWLYLALVVVQVALEVGAHFAMLAYRTHAADRDAMAALSWGLGVVVSIERPLLLGAFAVGFVWINAAFAGLPPKERPLSGGRALLRFLIPIYDVYWLFAVLLRLCRAIDDARARRSLPARAPRALAIAAPATLLAMPLLVQLLPSPPFPGVVGLPVFVAFLLVRSTPIALWFAFMRSCDRAREGLGAARRRGKSRGDQSAVSGAEGGAK